MEKNIILFSSVDLARQSTFIKFSSVLNFFHITISSLQEPLGNTQISSTWFLSRFISNALVQQLCLILLCQLHYYYLSKFFCLFYLFLLIFCLDFTLSYYTLNQGIGYFVVFLSTIFAYINHLLLSLKCHTNEIPGN